ncbi:MAG TPA: DUF4254 domain-containing protein [Planctomycetota bacterium]|nr:DUF4254 domain-containing protein [Planctomycetota bacterium]
MQLKKDEQPVDDELRQMAQKIASCQTIWTQVWHGAGSGAPTDPLMALVQDEHRRNFDLWHEEDKARAPDATDAQIAAVKRAIDKLNQQRNDLIEKVDEHLASMLKGKGARPSPHAAWNSETPGSVIDRLSILSLKVYHMREQAERLDAKPEHVQKCRDRLKILTQQQHDLTEALQNLFDDLFAARKQMKIYRQYKMYNDPDSNPAIYGAKGNS